MAQKRGLVEIRLDRRQAFHAVIGSLLIVSVAFVVGLIVGQRMQLSNENPAEPALVRQLVSPTPPAEPPAEAPPAQAPVYTFYEELSAESPRPLLLPTETPIGEPAGVVRPLDRQEEVEAPLPGVSQELAQADTPEPPRQPAAVEAPPRVAEPSPEPVPEATPRPASETEVQRDERVASHTESTGRQRGRTVVRLSPIGDGPEEFGFFTVEVGRFPTFSQANELRTRLRSAGHDAIVTIVSNGDEDDRHYRVQVGSFTRRTDADHLARQIADLGIRAAVVQEG